MLGCSTIEFITLEQATHVLIKGRDGKVEVSELKNLTQRIAPLLSNLGQKGSKSHPKNNAFYVSTQYG